MLLEARDLRVDTPPGSSGSSGAPCIDGLSLESQGRRLLVLGAPRGLFAAVSGMIAPSRGSLLIDGEPSRSALALNLVAGAPLDPPLPPTWTPRSYTSWSSRLAGHTAPDAGERTDRALDRLAMTAVANLPLRGLPLHIRRATVIAAALATGARTLVLEDPTAGLPDEIARTFGRIVLDALGEAPFIVFAGRAPLDAPISLAADEAILLNGSAVAAQGPLRDLAAHEATYAVRVVGESARFAELVRARGGVVNHGAEGALMTVHLAGDCKRTRDLLDAADEAKAVLVELRPIARAFA
jgi:ABC-type multidrug transport system ATPase subunit